MANILIISPSRSVKGGISTVINGYMNSNLPSFHKFHFVSSHIDGIKLTKLIVAVFGLLKTLFVLTTCHIDIVHIHCGDIKSIVRKYFYAHLVSVFSCKTVIHFHGASFKEEYPNYPAFVQKKICGMFQKIDLIICLSKSWQCYIEKIAPRSNTIVLQNGIHIPGRNSFLKKETITLLFLGLIGKRKGIFDLLTVISKLKSSSPDIQLIIGGNGDIIQLEKKIKALQIEKIVNYVGWIPISKKKMLLKNTDIFVLPSYGEGMPMSILEAMSYGVPVVSTAVGGIPEIVQHGVSGFLIEPGDLSALAGKLELLIKDNKLREDMGNNARKAVQQHHDINIIAKKLDKIYNSLLQ